MPVVIGSAWARVMVRAHADGTINARGDAIGANAHLCSLSGDRLAFDRRTGWFTGPQAASDYEPEEWRGRPMPVLLLHGDRAAVFQNGRAYDGGGGDPRTSDYASCGMRAAFSDLIRVPLTQDELSRLWETFESP